MTEETATTTKTTAKSKPDIDVATSPEAYLSGIYLKDGQKMRFCPTCHEKPLSRTEVDPETKQSIQVRFCPLQEKACGFIK